MSPSLDAITARRARSGAHTIIVLEGVRPDGRWEALTAVVAPSGPGFEALHRASGLDGDAREALLEAATPSGVLLAPWNVEAARLALARAFLATRIAERTLPAWTQAADALAGDLEGAARKVEDVYCCAHCDAPLAPRLQRALARAHGRAGAVLGCPACCGGEAAPVDPTEAALAHAWLAWSAGDPRRALVYAARAEGRRAAAAEVDAVRGAALLALANPVEATPHLRRAADAEPGDERLHGLLIDALARAGYLATAAVEVERLGRLRPRLTGRAAAVRHALGSLMDRGGAGGRERALHATLEALHTCC